MANAGTFIGFSGVEYKPNKAGIVGVMKSKGMESIVGDEARLIAAAANMLARDKDHKAHFGSRTKEQRYAVKGYAYTGNIQAMYDNARHDTLHRAI